MAERVLAKHGVGVRFPLSAQFKRHCPFPSVMGVNPRSNTAILVDLRLKNVDKSVYNVDKGHFTYTGSTVVNVEKSLFKSPF